MVSDLPLNPFWKSLSAEFIQDGVWSVPVKFKTVQTEYAAVKKYCGLLDLSYRGKVEVRGNERADFLHRLLTNNILRLKPGMSTYAALLNAPGKVLADMHVDCFEDHFLLDLEMGLDEKTMVLLDQFIIADDVALSMASGRFIHLLLAGPAAAALLEKKGAPDVLKLKTGYFCRGISGFIRRKNERDFEWILPAESGEKIARQLLETGKSFGLEPFGLETSEVLRVEAGELRYGRDMDETVSFPETGLDEIACDETKGCYPGQEVVARTKTYKGLQRKIVKLIFEKEASPKAGDRIYSEEKEIGRITSVSSKPEALGYVSKGFFEGKTEIKIRRDEKMPAGWKLPPEHDV